MAAADHFHVGSGSNHKNEYRPRNPEDSLLYRTIAGHLETFLAHQRERGREVPHFVEREMRAYLSCGVLACGFLRLQCESCGKDRLLPLSCKGRSVCPSCGGRRVSGCERKPDRAQQSRDGRVPFGLVIRIACRLARHFNCRIDRKACAASNVIVIEER